MNPCLFQPQLWAICLLISGLAFGGGYVKGMLSAEKACEQKEVKAENKELKEVAKKEHNAAIELSEIGKSYVEEKKQNVSNSVAVAGKFNGLRVKSSCASLPTDSASGSRIDAAGTEERNKPRSVDFGSLAAEIARLGLDYDNAISKIVKLQETVTVYQKVCGVANP